MEIKWYGQASFGIETFDKVKIVTDPYNHDTSGFKPYSEPADIVISAPPVFVEYVYVSLRTTSAPETLFT